jgi:predicted MFS family arabinose efflux permease
MLRGRLERAAGGAWQARQVVLLAGVLGLSVADTATVGAVALPLERGLSIGNTQIGLLVTAAAAVAAVAALPLGVLADRVDRVRLLTAAIVVWSGMLLVCGSATSFAMLLLARLVLGVLVATAGPVVASLTGDLFPAVERGRVYGLILTGELVGIAVGFVAGGEIAAALSWRWAFWVLAVPGLVLAAAVHRGLAEPRRSTHHGRPHPGATDTTPGADRQGHPSQDPMARMLVSQGVQPHRERVIVGDPAGWSLWRAAVYLLSTRTVLALVLASGLGYFFLSGFKTFGVLYVQGRFGVGQGTAVLLLAAIGVGGLVGVQLAGRLADQLTSTGHLAARPVVAGLAFALAATAVVPALLVGSATVALGLLVLTTVGLGGANPPLDAARLDLVHPRLWGRAEAIRTVLRQSLEAGAPLLVGYLSVRLGAHTSSVGDGDGGPSGVPLGQTFLILAATLVAAAVLLLWTGRRTYPADVATTLATHPTQHADSAPPVTAPAAYPDPDPVCDGDQPHATPPDNDGLE